MTYNEVMTYVGLSFVSAVLIAVMVCPLIPGWLAWLERGKDEKKD